MPVRRAPSPWISAVAAAAWLAGCPGERGPSPGRPADAPPAAASASNPPIFSDVAAASGIDFVHFNGMSGEFYYCEMVGAGGAFLDYDDDGDLDVLLVQGTMLGPGRTLAQAFFPPRGPLPPNARLYRNDLEVGTGGAALRFTDVTAASGIEAAGYGMGVATGDVDNDGFVDLYLTSFGRNQMLRNDGDGTFSDVTAASGTDDARWSTSAAFFDLDRDGWLDLFVCNYVDYGFANLKRCTARFSNAQDYCGPLSYVPVPNRLFRNRGDGVFEDWTVRSRIAREYDGALGVVPGDYDADGWADLYVANDGRPNHLWMNQRDGTFRNVALLSGCAVSGEGKPESGMGVDAGDVDADGDEDLFVTNLMTESNRLYLRDASGVFEDETAVRGLGGGPQPHTGFGTGWLDFDNDGWLDLLVVNGSVAAIEAQARAGDRFPLRQPNQLFRNLGGGRFEDVSRLAGDALTAEAVGRGAAFGDVDNDGDTDVLLTSNAGPARLLVNDVGSLRPWIGLRLVGERGRDMLGAWVGVVRPGVPTLWRRVRTASSYCSASDPRVLVGLGDSAEVAAVRVRWPSGREETWRAPAARAYTTLREGTGGAAEP